MENILFEQLSEKHRRDIIDIFNYYVEYAFSAYPEENLDYSYYDKFLMISKSFPAYAIYSNHQIVGFCYLNAYNTLPVFRETATVTYFLEKDHRAIGIGKLALDKLENEAKKLGVKNLLANISSVNEASLAFHYKNGFKKCGEFESIITKHGKTFDIIWVQKRI